MVIPFRKFSTKKEAILTSKIDQLIITIGIIMIPFRLIKYTVFSNRKESVVRGVIE